MTGFAVRRLAQAIPTVLLVATVVFVLVRLVPGDPVETMLGDGARPSEMAALRAELGLDRPIAVQYVRFLGDLLRGDLGVSYLSGRPVRQILAEHVPATAELAVASLGFALLTAVPLGLLAAVKRGRVPDHLARFVALVGVSMPSFWLGPMLILVVAIRWDLLPVSGRSGPASVVLPAITLGAALAGLLARMVRAAVAEELERPYVVTARAKGLSKARVLVHAGANALVPLVTVVGLQFGTLLTGAIITETIFAWPGMGRLLIRAIHMRDLPVLQGGVLLIALTYVAVNAATDLLYGRLDPRARTR